MLGLRLKRSQSFTEKKRVDEDGLNGSLGTPHDTKLDMEILKGCDKKKSPSAEVHSSLKQEILQLEKRLQTQFEVRHALEKAFSHRSSILASNTSESSITKSATELVREIAVLELEVVYLEQYLLSLYRQAFDEKVSSISPPSKDLQIKSPSATPRARFFKASQPDATPKRENLAPGLISQSIDNPWKESSDVDHDLHCFSQSGHNTSSSLISLAEHLGTCISDHVPFTPNRLAEDMIKCMSSIYCKLADPPSTNQGFSSPSSSFSSVGGFSPQEQCNMWSPSFRNNPFHGEGLKEFSGPYSTMFEVLWIYRDKQKLSDIEHLLQEFRSLVSQLEEVNPRKLNREEKLAFWINIHNALVMHAFLAYGVPQNNMKRVFLLLKAAYNIGGIIVSVDTIQSSILGCRVSRPRQWLRLLLSAKSKFRSEDERQGYAIGHPEPLLHFALCSGSHSDPPVRVYTPKRIFQDLEAAKDEHIHATFAIGKDGKVLLPKTVELYAKDSGLCEVGVMEMIQESLPESLKKSIKKRQVGKAKKSIEWIPQNFTFRFLIPKGLVK